jgi:hypothetical protein
MDTKGIYTGEDYAAQSQVLNDFSDSVKMKHLYYKAQTDNRERD